jgi:two-component system alkaline phosphatase synthesis response regulator PhoP
MKKILVAEDEENVLKVLKLVLEGANYTVIVARDGEEALAQVEKEHPDMVVTDLSMPKIDGGKLCRIIKGSPKYSHIKVVVCSALNREVAKQKLFLPADDYLVKPVDVDLLLGTVKTLFA